MAAVLVVAGCSSDGRTLDPPTFPLPQRQEAPAVAAAGPSNSPASTVAIAAAPTVPSPAPPTVADVAASAREFPIEVERLFSPANAIAEMVGTGATAVDPVTVGGEPADVLNFDVDSARSFVVQVWIADDGAHTVCIADTCGRVFTLAPDAQTPEEVIATIEQAIPFAEEILDFRTLFPDWDLVIGGALAGTGGSTDDEAKVVTIYRNRGRSIDDFVRTILHEYGHVADFELLDETDRVEYLAIRGIDPDTPWRDDDAHRLDQWGLQPSEDFAEVMAMLWSDGAWLPRTGLADVPTPEMLVDVSSLL
jgi:hypothetical protein